MILPREVVKESIMKQPAFNQIQMESMSPNSEVGRHRKRKCMSIPGDLKKHVGAKRRGL